MLHTSAPHLRQRTRRLGAELTNGLLWAAFALAMVIAIFGVRAYLSQQEMRTNSVNAAAQIASQVGILTALNKRADSDALYQDVINSGSVADDYLLNFGPDRYIVLPSWGVIDIYNDPLSDGYVVSVAYAFPDEASVKMCQYMANGQIGQFRDVGPLGVNYAIGTRECNNPTYPLFTAVFQR